MHLIDLNINIFQTIAIQLFNTTKTVALCENFREILALSFSSTLYNFLISSSLNL